MNRGLIPGYYYDEEKEKYFKVQANHVAPPEAKYSKSNVKHEQQEAKKRKREEKHEQIMQKQTVPVARLRKNQLLGASGFQREHGDKVYAAYDLHRNAAFVHGLESSEVEIVMDRFSPSQTRLVDAQHVSQTSQTLLTVAHSPGCHALYAFDDSSRWYGRLTLPSASPLHAFHDKVIHTSSWTAPAGIPYAFACSSQGNLSSGNACWALLADLNMDSVTYAWNVGGGNNTLWDCKLRNTPESCPVFVGTHGASICDADGQRSAGLPPSAFGTYSEAFACEWLDRKTVAIGTRNRIKRLTSHRVFLWDIRTQGGIAARFACRDRITGIHRPDESGKTLLVTSNSAINQYDTRVMRAERPLVSLSHSSPQPNLHLSIYRGDIVAAVDQHQKLQTYSLRSGRHVRTFNPSKRRAGLLETPRWQEDERGTPYLQACYGNTLQRWTWQGSESDESET